MLMVLSEGQAERPSHEVRSMMIYNFIKYIQWPVEAEICTIGVIGDDAVYNSLYNWYNGQLRGNKRFMIKKFDRVDQVGDCDVLYVGAAAADGFGKLKTKLANSPTLIITNKPGLGARGSAINFVRVNNKQLFELNKKVIEKANLKVSNKLTGLAILI